jgi:hypothetical protein
MKRIATVAAAVVIAAVALYICYLLYLDYVRAPKMIGILSLRRHLEEYCTKPTGLPAYRSSVVRDDTVNFDGYLFRICTAQKKVHIDTGTARLLIVTFGSTAVSLSKVRPGPLAAARKSRILSLYLCSAPSDFELEQKVLATVPTDIRRLSLPFHNTRVFMLTTLRIGTQPSVEEGKPIYAFDTPTFRGFVFYVRSSFYKVEIHLYPKNGDGFYLGRIGSTKRIPSPDLDELIYDFANATKAQRTVE